MLLNLVEVGGEGDRALPCHFCLQLQTFRFWKYECSTVSKIVIASIHMHVHTSHILHIPLHTPHVLLMYSLLTLPTPCIPLPLLISHPCALIHVLTHSFSPHKYYLHINAKWESSSNLFSLMIFLTIPSLK